MSPNSTRYVPPATTVTARNSHARSKRQVSRGSRRPTPAITSVPVPLRSSHEAGATGQCSSVSSTTASGPIAALAAAPATDPNSSARTSSGRLMLSSMPLGRSRAKTSTDTTAITRFATPNASDSEKTAPVRKLPATVARNSPTRSSRRRAGSFQPLASHRKATPAAGQTRASWVPSRRVARPSATAAR